MALPFLPGNSFNRKLGCEKFHKPQHFNFSQDQQILVNGKPGIGGEPILGTKTRRENIFADNYEHQIPSWIAFDKKVLCFDSWYRELVVESQVEKYRVHYCKIYFYLEDSTIQIVEPRLKNSGLTQGTVLKRHRILKDPSDEESHWGVEDLNLAIDLPIYGKVYRIINCDRFTHNFLYKIGIKINDPEELPADPYNQLRSSVEGQMHPLKPYQVIDTLGQFLAMDSQVLRFYCYWDDTESLYGDFRSLILHYYLADDTIEILEVYPKNCGRDKAPVFLRRDKLPKNLEKLPAHGQITKRTVLNVFGPMGAGSRSILDSLRTGEYNVDFYSDSDLKIGNVLNVYGRKIVLVDCDEFTKNYYNQIYGLVDFEPIEYRKPRAKKPAKKFPPYTGFGTEEDSLVSCLMMELKPPFKNLDKFLQYGGCGYISNVLRFTAKIVSEKEVDLERSFVISYFLSDDTLMIFEISPNNSGFVGGKFLERQKVRLPDQPRYNTELSEYYSVKDLYIGNTLNINSFNFVLTNADEYAFSYMEAHPSEFQYSDFALVEEKLNSEIKQRRDEILSIYGNSTKQVDYEEFRDVTNRAFPSLNLQEIMTLARKYASKKQVSTSHIIQISVESLRKNMWNDFEGLSNLFYHYDVGGTGVLSVHQTSNAMKSIKMPLHSDVLKLLLKNFTDVNEKIDYSKLVTALDWRKQEFSLTDTWSDVETKNDLVNYPQFYHHFFESECS